jgi:hypothetical protein
MATPFEGDRRPSGVALWAEFEPPTTGTHFGTSPTGGLPESWHTLLPIPPPPEGAQNTDPWIFGESFRYGYCYQIHRSFLRSLRRGDLLLFGSYKKLDAEGNATRIFNFFLDTVFVVESSFALRTPVTIPHNLFDLVYRRAAYDLWPDDREYCTFYKGVMLGDQPSAAPFSYSPCASCEGHSPVRVARPMIGDLFHVEYGHGQVFTTVPIAPGNAWHMVTRRCFERGYSLAVKVEDAVIAPGTENVTEPVGPRGPDVNGSGRRRPGPC